MVDGYGGPRTGLRHRGQDRRRRPDGPGARRAADRAASCWARPTTPRASASSTRRRLRKMPSPAVGERGAVVRGPSSPPATGTSSTRPTASPPSTASPWRCWSWRADLAGFFFETDMLASLYRAGSGRARRLHPDPLRGRGEPHERRAHAPDLPLAALSLLPAARDLAVFCGRFLGRLPSLDLRRAHVPLGVGSRAGRLDPQRPGRDPYPDRHGHALRRAPHPRVSNAPAGPGHRRGRMSRRSPCSPRNPAARGTDPLRNHPASTAPGRRRSARPTARPHPPPRAKTHLPEGPGRRVSGEQRREAALAQPEDRGVVGRGRCPHATRPILHLQQHRPGVLRKDRVLQLQPKARFDPPRTSRAPRAPPPDRGRARASAHSPAGPRPLPE